jgi:hypothetical protein
VLAEALQHAPILKQPKAKARGKARSKVKTEAEAAASGTADDVQDGLAWARALGRVVITLTQHTCVRVVCR